LSSSFELRNFNGMDRINRINEEKTDMRERAGRADAKLFFQALRPYLSYTLCQLC